MSNETSATSATFANEKKPTHAWAFFVSLEEPILV